MCFSAHIPITDKFRDRFILELSASFRYIAIDSYRYRQNFLSLILVTLLKIQLDSADIYGVNFSHSTGNWRETSEIKEKGFSIHVLLFCSGKTCNFTVSHAQSLGTAYVSTLLSQHHHRACFSCEYNVLQWHTRFPVESSSRKNLLLSSPSVCRKALSTLCCLQLTSSDI